MTTAFTMTSFDTTTGNAMVNFNDANNTNINLNVALTITNNAYPVGAALTTFLQGVVDDYVATQTAQLAAIASATNAAAVAAAATPLPAPVPTTAQLIKSFMVTRDRLLRRTDYIMATDYTLPSTSTATLAQWKTYRQTLRDIPTAQAATGYPVTITWPVAPGPITDPTDTSILKSDGTPIIIPV